MAVSVFDLFTVGIGPSSSHTVGPMRAARKFILQALEEKKPHRILVELYGSLGHTGKGHGSDIAILLGLEGERPSLVDTDSVPTRVETIKANNQINLNKQLLIDFEYRTDLIFHRKKTLPGHANGMKFSIFDIEGNISLEKIYYSVGGGFIIGENTNAKPIANKHLELPYDFQTGDQLLTLAKQSGLSISQLMLENEKTWRKPEDIASSMMLVFGLSITNLP